MKKIFTLALAACFGMMANAQDTSGWKAGDDVTDQIQWKAYDAFDEDPANPAWQGFAYGASGEWEFRPADADPVSAPPGGTDGNTNTNFMCWGAYNLPPVDVYQDFEIPAGIYTLSVAGCYRHGQDGVTLDLFAAGKKTENCFVYAKVGDKVYQEPIMYKFNPEVTEQQSTYTDWMKDGQYQYKGYTIWSPQCHSGADVFIENGYFNGNDVMFVVPEKMIIRVGISKPVAVSQDQIWWNHWKMYYEGEYDPAASEALVAAKTFNALKAKAEDFVGTVSDTYSALSALMFDEIGDIEIEDQKSLESVNAAIAAIQAADALNRSVFAKTQTMESVIGICEGILKLTDYPGAAALEAAVATAKSLLFSEELDESTTLQSFIDAGEALGAARIAYLLTQEKAEDGSQDFTHAVSYPWFVNQEFTPSYQYTTDKGINIYQFPDPVEYDYFSANDENWTAPGDEKVNLETGKYGEEANNQDSWKDYIEYPISDKAHWSTDLSVENQWVYEDTWGGWHGGYQGYVMKLKGYAAWYSAWAAGANGKGAMEIRQVVTNLPDGFYTLEGRMFCANDGYEDNITDETLPRFGQQQGYEHIFIRDKEGKDLAKKFIDEGLTPHDNNRVGFWGFWGRDGWIQVTTDFVNITGGKATIGYSHNTMAGNAGVTLKYFGKEIDYTGIIQKKVEAITDTDLLWAADKAAFDAIIAKIQYPIGGEQGYADALAIIAEAENLKTTALKVTKNFNLGQQYLNMSSDRYEEECTQTEIIDCAWGGVLGLGEGDNDSYKDAEKANEIYNKYVEYLDAYDDALGYPTDAMKAVLEAQAKDLKANYASVSTLVKYMEQIATEKNNAIFDELCKNATEANPVNITEKYIKNASFAEGPKAGWTIKTLPGDGSDDPDMTINTYGRQLAESWNRKPFEISQTLYSMPAGTYELRVRACYRSGGSVTDAMVSATADGTFEYNAKLFANGYATDVKSVCDNGEDGQGWEDPSFTVWYNGSNAKEALEAIGIKNVNSWESDVYVSEDEYAKIAAEWENDADRADDLYNLTEGKKECNNDYPFDSYVGGAYYPSSMCGFKDRITKSPKAYCNSVQAYLPEVGTLKFGFRKEVAIGGDWLIYDDFELYYLGPNASTGITNVNSESGAKAIYNMAGQRLNTLQKGINIVDGKKIFVK